MSLLVDSEAGLLLSMVHFSPSLQHTIAKLLMWVWCIMKRESFTLSFMCLQALLLTNHLHGKEAKLYLTNS